MRDQNDFLYSLRAKNIIMPKTVTYLSFYSMEPARYINWDGLPLVPTPRRTTWTSKHTTVTRDSNGGPNPIRTLVKPEPPKHAPVKQ